MRGDPRGTYFSAKSLKFFFFDLEGLNHLSFAIFPKISLTWMGKNGGYFKKSVFPGSSKKMNIKFTEKSYFLHKLVPG